MTGWNFNLRRSALVAGHVVGIGLIMAELLQGSAVDRVSRVRPRKTHLPETSRPARRPATALEYIQKQALFHASRSFYVPPPAPAMPVDLKPPVPAYRVATVLMSGRQLPIALLTESQGKGVIKVHQGDVVAGWTVESVAARKVTLVFKDDHIELGPKLAAGTPTGSSLGVAGPTSSSESRFVHPNILSAGSASTGLRVLGTGANVVAPGTGAGRPVVAPRVFAPPPR